MKRIVISSAVLALAIGGMGVGSAEPAVYKVTGGGQTLVPEDGGAGDTIAFSAQSQGEEGTAAKGQFQYQDRTGGTGKDHTTLHGTITCVVVFPAGTADEGGAAALGGTLTDGRAFRVDVTDNGQGAQGSDMILARFGEDAQGDNAGLCDPDDRPEEDLPALSRGNVKIHKGKADGGSEEENGGGKGKGGGLSLLR